MHVPIILSTKHQLTVLYLESHEDSRRQFQDYEPKKEIKRKVSKPAYIKPVQFMDPESGPRLNVFDPVDTKKGTTEKRCLSEVSDL